MCLIVKFYEIVIFIIKKLIAYNKIINFVINC